MIDDANKLLQKARRLAKAAAPSQVESAESLAALDTASFRLAVELVSMAAEDRAEEAMKAVMKANDAV